MPWSISIVAQDVGPDGTHNMLVRSIPKRFDPDAFLTVSTRVAFDPTSNFQFAGLMIGGADPDVDRLQLGRSYCDVDVCALGGLYFDRIESGNFVGDNYALPFENAPGLLIQLAAREFSPGEWVVLGAYSFDGEDWTPAGEHFVDFEPQLVGLIAGQAPDELLASFEFFELEM